MEIIFALYDSDVLYATRFMDFFKKRKDFPFEIVIFTQRESLEEYLLYHKVEILLIGNSYEGEISKEQVSYCYRLTEYPVKKQVSETFVIYKYQEARGVMSELLKDYHQRKNEPAESASYYQKEIISVFAPGQNIQDLSFGWAISSMLSEQKKTLFVVGDLLPIQLIDSISVHNSLSEFIYYLKENNNIITKMEALLEHPYGISYLGGISHGDDLLSLRREDIQNWMEELQHTEYQSIVFYLGFYSEAAIEIMKLSSKVLATHSGTAYDLERHRSWKEQMERSKALLSPEQCYTVELIQEHPEQLPITMKQLSETLAWKRAEELIL